MSRPDTRSADCSYDDPGGRLRHCRCAAGHSGQIKDQRRLAIYYSLGLFAGDCNPVHETPVAMIVVDGEMLDTAIVPHRQ